MVFGSLSQRDDHRDNHNKDDKMNQSCGTNQSGSIAALPVQIQNLNKVAPIINNQNQNNQPPNTTHMNGVGSNKYSSGSGTGENNSHSLPLS